MRRLTTEEFIERAKLIHPNYDYLKTIYINRRTKIKFICPEHGTREQLPDIHLKSGCKSCGIEASKNKRKATQNEIIEEFKKTHGDKYDYSKVNYINSETKVEIVCPKHGSFWQLPYEHKNGANCPYCSKRKKSTSIFIEQLKNIYNNKYDYNLVNYINANTKVKLVCPIHGVFEQTPNNLLNGHGCAKCGIEKRSIKNTLTNSEFIDKANKIHHNKYDYSLINYINSTTKIKIVCKMHGIFNQLPSDHLSGCGCPYCNESKGEEKIANILTENKIKFIREFKFNDCKDKSPLPFDFYLPNYNLVIEYDGEQHFENICFDGKKSSLEYIKNHDKIKNKYCKNKGINILRISYKDFSNIEKIIKAI